MAGVGFLLERMARQGSLSALGAAYSYALFLTAGPWIFVVLGMAALDAATCPTELCAPTELFRSVVVYNFCSSLLLSGMISLPVTRYVSDQIYLRSNDRIVAAYVSALAVYAAIGCLLVGPFYVFLVDLPAPEKVAAFGNFMLVGATWIIVPFVGVMRNYRLASLAFLLGMGVMVAVAWATTTISGLVLLQSFNAGLAVVNALLLLRLSREYGVRLVLDRSMFRAILRYWDLAALGLVYYAGMWIDKIIMWFASPSGSLRVAGVITTMPDYDAAMFWAQLTTIPVMVIFFLYVETEFYRLYRRFYDCFGRNASKLEIDERLQALGSFVTASVLGLFAAMVTTSLMAVLLSYQAIELIGLRANQTGMLRAGLFGAAFYASATFCFIFMLYFDLRRHALMTMLVFLLANAVFTAGFIQLGFSYYGYGYMLASAISFMVAVASLLRELPWLHFHAFVTNNSSIQRPKRSPRLVHALRTSSGP